MRKVADHFELAEADPVGEQPPAGTVRGPVADVAVPTLHTAGVGLGLERQLLAHVGRYRLKAVLAEGEPGTVYEAWDPLLARGVAVKTLQFGLGMSSRIAIDRRLLQAARAGSHLNHRYIAPIHDAGLTAQGVYLTLERLHGRDPRRALAEGWQPTVGQSLKFVRRVADAVAYAHSRGVVHGDLKPSSLFVMRSGRPKVLNFGIGRVLGDPTIPELAGLHLGWPHYQAPEQIQHQAPDERSDVYALGLILYEMLAGHKAFARDNLQSLRQGIVTGSWMPLDQIRPDLPASVVRTVHGALALEPSRRPASALALAQALRDAEEEVAGSLIPVQRPLAALARVVRHVPSPFATIVAFVSRHPGLRWPLTASLFGLAAWALASGVRDGAHLRPADPDQPVVHPAAAPAPSTLAPALPRLMPLAADAATAAAPRPLTGLDVPSLTPSPAPRD